MHHTAFSRLCPFAMFALSIRAQILRISTGLHGSSSTLCSYVITGRCSCLARAVTNRLCITSGTDPATNCELRVVATQFSWHRHRKPKCFLRLGHV